jgi:hypothetical protein
MVSIYLKYLYIKKISKFERFEGEIKIPAEVMTSFFDAENFGYLLGTQIKKVRVRFTVPGLSKSQSGPGPG